MQPLIVEYCGSELTNFQLYFCSLFPTFGNKAKHFCHPCASAQETLEDVSEMPGFREEKRLTRSVSCWKLRKGKPGMGSLTKAVISFKTSIVHFTELVNTLEQAIFPPFHTRRLNFSVIWQYFLRERICHNPEARFLSIRKGIRVPIAALP